ncbi:MAG: phosphoribosylformylglycinamidine synthase, purS protein [Candidatus Nitrosopelagicus sp.]|jgi:phosphoribosylformylglycinamidine synthase PurS subunit|nr:phosphoribosylformylglycinamidine synthase subunit PurS [Thermoproteota archaeon]RMW40580.1 MAG: phosphoribosylformylglycinamidine synthase, purS protein [Candidatus Nitrosopelagicus sp.]|tara:strand:+ start:1034 stop:1294 length:261 start_codon:yes stop_codon:yes gene_type:complete
MPDFQVSVVIENKPGISDPEGDTILNDLVLKGKNKNISKIRSGTILKFSITENDENAAKDEVLKICDELRIYNPLVSKVTAAVEKI